MKRLFLIIIVFFLLPIVVRAEDYNQNIEESLKNFDTQNVIDKIPEETKEDLFEIGLQNILSDGIKSFSFKGVINAVARHFNRSFFSLKSLCISIIVILIFNFCVSACEIGDGFSSICQYMAMLCLICITGGAVVEVARETGQVVIKSTEFMLSYVPLFSLVIATGGCPLSANTYSFFLICIIEFLNRTITTFFLPFTGVFTALSLCSALSLSTSLKSISATIKKIFIILLASSVGILSFFLSIQNFMAQTADQASMKTLSFLAGSFVPIVGGAIKQAMSSLRGCMLLIKATVGSLGIFVGILMFLPITLKLFLLKFLFGISKSMFDITGAKEMVNVLKGLTDSVTIILAVLLSVCFLMVISTGIMLSMGCGLN